MVPGSEGNDFEAGDELEVADIRGEDAVADLEGSGADEKV